MYYYLSFLEVISQKSLARMRINYKMLTHFMRQINVFPMRAFSLSRGQWLHTAVDHYNLIQGNLFKAEMRNGVDDIHCVGKRSPSNVPAPDCCYAVLRRGLTPTYKQVLKIETISLRFSCLHKKPNWGSPLQIQWWITWVKDGLAFRRNTPYLRRQMFLSWLQGTFWIQTGSVVHRKRWRQSNKMTILCAVPVLERQNTKVWDMFKVKHVFGHTTNPHCSGSAALKWSVRAQ